MAFPLLGTPKPTFLNASGDPLVEGYLYVYDPADDTEKATYPTADDADAATNANANPIVLNSRGEPPNGLFGVDYEKYKLTLTDEDGTTIWSVDDVRSPTVIPTLYGKTAQTLTDSGAVTLTESTTFVITTAAAALTLADGVENQRKFIVMQTDGGVATLTPTNLANGTSIVFNAVGQSADLIFANSAWHWLGGTAIHTGQITDAVTFTSADATPSVLVGNQFITAGTTAITDFDDGQVGQTITINAASSITITDGAAVELDGSRNFDMVDGDTLTLHMFTDQVWTEIARTHTTNDAPGVREYGGGTQSLTGPGAIDVTSSISYITTTGADALTLADGSQGQRKFIVMVTDGGAGTLTPTNLGNGATITFDDVGDSADLLFASGNWYFMGGTATLA